jgi:cyclic beta-1,2-glucan synthetase
MSTTATGPTATRDRGGPPGPSLSERGPTEPIRAEQLGLDRLEARARALAREAKLAPAGAEPRPAVSLRRRFVSNGHELARARAAIAAASARQEALTPDAEWLLDNYHIIDDTLREVRQDLPRGYYRELPKLASGPYAGLPRVYALSVELVAHTDSALDEANLTHFVQAYQQIAPLTIGELWAVPIMLRIVLVENLRRLAEQMLMTRVERQQAESTATTVADLARRANGRPAPLSWSDAFVVRLLQVLRDRDTETADCVEWLELCLTHHGPGRAELVRREHRRQAANQVSVGNCVTSLRLLSNLDWNVFFERTSVVEALLRDDPARVYARQDFATKDRYRRRVERLARRSGREESAVARRVLELAGAVGGTGDEPAARAAAHVGFYLEGPGRHLLEQDLAYRPAAGEWLRRTALDHPEAVYFGGLVAGTALVLAAILSASGGAGWWLALAGVGVLLPATEIAVGLLHYLLTLTLPPRILAKLDFKDGIPGDCATIVVMPTLLARVDDAAALADRLEVHYLSNPDSQLRFALLTDFADAPAEHMPEDDSLVAAALQRIRVLNRRHAAAGPDRFYLFHRRRLWNAKQQCWMGYERKRGKLAEFNRLLRGAGDTSYAVVSGDPRELPRIQYVITLDADTQLPRESAGRLIGTLSHPLNRPAFDPVKRRVVEGYGVLQPRVSLSLVAGTRSLFARILASSAGIDPYTTAVSDVYQDLFGRGTFTGKGIYDVDAFEAATGPALPDNRILSHDLIEGNFARCGLVSDIELLDDFPARYNAYARREHRWVRGDWQIAAWVLPRVPAASATGGETRVPNPLPTLERWKVLDNLRRSLVPPSLVVLLLLGWTVLPGSAWFWSAIALLTLAMPLVILIVNWLCGTLRSGAWYTELLEVKRSLIPTAGQVALSAVLLAAQAHHMLDAIVRTMWRLLVSHRNLLEWETASQTERRLGAGFLQFAVSMAGAPALAVVGLVVTAIAHPVALPAALPWLAAWFISPLVAWYVSLPRVRAESPLLDDERRELRRIARNTWHFFDTFVNDTGHWLPPDNYQEVPKGQIAYRTSPTNMGLYLLSALSAHDFGYTSLGSLADRLERTFATFDQLERFHGHFHNWYDTKTLAVLEPHYISTVDSGNLLGCLVALKQGLLAKASALYDLRSVQAGLKDTLGLVARPIRALRPPGPEDLDAISSLGSIVKELETLLERPPTDLLAAREWLAGIAERAKGLSARLPALASALGEALDELDVRANRLVLEATAWLDELSGLAPWLTALQTSRAAPAPAAAASTDEVSTRWQDICDKLLDTKCMLELPKVCDNAVRALDELRSLGLTAEDDARVAALADAVRKSTAPALRVRLERLAARADGFAGEMDFKFLYNAQRHLFSIGFNRAAGRLDQSHYDLLASEASLTSFLAIARGDVPKRHWFQLGRQLTRGPAGTVALLSWGGTMFEYLMPRLLLRNYPGTLLDESARGAVGRQIEYGRQMRVPWGISESGFAALDASLDYQYQSFGVPGLGLKRGLSRDLVIAPYATALAVLVRPHAAAENFRALAAERARGEYGFYEAIDYTRDRLREKRRSAVVRSYMAHHQGMSLVALANCLLDLPMVRRFHAEPMVRATELLLQERVPAAAPVVELHEDEVGPAPVVREGVLPMSRRITTPDTPHPRTHLLSNGHYTVMLTNAGSGFSTCRDLDVTRWREDRTTDAWGQWIYIRDLREGTTWSAGYHPVGRAGDLYEAVFSTDKVEFRRRDGGIETHLEVTVSPEHAAELRRLTITNHNLRFHEFEVTSYVEIVLAPRRADAAHPAFGKLFLETEWVPRRDALLCRRRPRAENEKPIWGVHVFGVDRPAAGPTQYETDRGRFLGRGRSVAAPAALDGPLSGTTGAVLDPVLCLRRRVRVAPGASVSVGFTTAVAATREEALALADQYHDIHGVTRAFELAWAHTQVQLRHLKLSTEEAHLFQRLAAHVLYAGAALRAPAAVIAANRLGQSELWRYGISGDKPIVLVRFADADEMALVRQVLLAHHYWRLQGLEVDLVLFNEHPTAYQDETTQLLQSLVRSSDSHSLTDKPGGVFIRRADQVPEADRVLLQAIARVVLVGSRGSLSAQVDRREASVAQPALLELDAEGTSPPSRAAAAALPEGLLFFNGTGGFTPDGREYVIALPRETPGARQAAYATLPPAPWINAVANDRCGFLISESGAGYTWYGNSQTNRLTPWSNDPVTDPPGEVIYLRDEATGRVWTPTPAPAGAGLCVVRHGQGYSTFTTVANGLTTELTVLVAPDDPVKLYRLTVRNNEARRRTLSAGFYAELVLGPGRDPAPLLIVNRSDGNDGPLLAQNSYNADFAGAVAFADVSLRPRCATGDRTEFLGRNGSVATPAALHRVALGGHFGSGLDPCFALLAPFTLRPHETKEIVFQLGEAENVEEALRFAARYRDPKVATTALEETHRRWDALLSAVQVRTPDSAFDLLLNGWLLYQVLSCRVRGRSAFYQSGGAYGFRDQLQDVMALAWSAPDESKAQILRAAARQFAEGDVQHWWHPPAGRGVRTRISDDFLWLPFVVRHHMEVTGDRALLEVAAPFLNAPPLRTDQEEDYGLPQTTEDCASIFEHCARALDNGLRYGPHGLPLMGTGDWNDGMNRVGPRRVVSESGTVTYDWDGKGESVWNAWMQLSVLPYWADVARARGETERAGRWRAAAERLRQAVEAVAPDGDWYRRAYFDDGTPLGSTSNDECQIDSLAQTWAVTSGAADPARARQAMTAVYERLVKADDGLILLFTPPFDKGQLHPGYIKGYVPGIRENGGQYTHGATWVVQAAAVLGEGTRAVDLFGLLNPINHAATAEGVAKYRVEPYVMAGDVYGAPPHTGRGGWTWYTGSAGWMYRVGLENILGFKRRGDRLRIDPCIPRGWKRFEMTVRHGSSIYRIVVENPSGAENGVNSVTVDGSLQSDGEIKLVDNGKTHTVRVTMDDPNANTGPNR